MRWVHGFARLTFDVRRSTFRVISVCTIRSAVLAREVSQVRNVMMVSSRCPAPQSQSHLRDDGDDSAMGTGMGWDWGLESRYLTGAALVGVGVSREGVVPRKRTRRWIYIFLPAYARAIELYRSQRESISIVTGALSRNI